MKSNYPDCFAFFVFATLEKEENCSWCQFRKMAFLFLSILKAYFSTECSVEIVTSLVFCHFYVVLTAANLEMRYFKGLNFAF